MAWYPNGNEVGQDIFDAPAEFVGHLLRPRG